MKQGIFISIIIPTYNRLSLLKRTLNCLEKQNYPSDRYEVIVVDDGSDDGTESYLRRAAAQGKLRYIRQENRGPAAARNRGVQAAQGEVVAFTDDDCLPDAGWLTYLAESYTSCNDSPPVAVGGCVENVSEGHWLYPFYAVQGNRHQSNQSDEPTYLDTANASFDRFTFLELGGFDESFPFPSGEDVDLGFRFLAAGYKLDTSTQAVVWHMGCPSLKGMMRQSFNRGRGTAILMLKYPDCFAGAPSQGVRLIVKRILKRLVNWASRVPDSIRPLALGVTSALYRAALSLSETEYFICAYLPKQKRRYQKFNLSPVWMIIYLSLECLDYLLQTIGRIIGTFNYSFNQASVVDP
jgi:glycosyltransferase involved in cell wall biosynthesis